jgi:hypothetical protein
LEKHNRGYQIIPLRVPLINKNKYLKKLMGKMRKKRDNSLHRRRRIVTFSIGSTTQPIILSSKTRSPILSILSQEFSKFLSK